MKKSKIVLIVILALLLIVAAVLGINYRVTRAVFRNWTAGTVEVGSMSGWQGGATYERVPYAEDSESQYVDIYVPDTGGEKPPLYVIIHGGGFIANDSQSKQARLMIRYFRDHGYACASINYRLAQEAPFPGGLSDCKAAIRFLRIYADEYGYDASKFAVFGESAGGYLATMCAVTADDEFTDVRCIGQDDENPVSTRPDILVDYYGHIDQQGDAEDWAALGIPRLIVKVANSWLEGGALDGYDDVHSYWYRKNVSEMTQEELDTANPYHYIDKNDLTGLSAWIIHGDCDITVPYLHSERLNARLIEKLGAENVSYKLVPGMGHASDPLYSDALLGELDAWMRPRLS